ncbi:uncharacterized protein DS421_12g374470 [Arachis hypogaea]|nr:uncharacterized protein DS421_12g374470 [Arachis hypogaea]
MLKALDPFYFTLAFWFKGLLAFSACFFFLFFCFLFFFAYIIILFASFFFIHCFFFLQVMIFQIIK